MKISKIAGILAIFGAACAIPGCSGEGQLESIDGAGQPIRNGVEFDDAEALGIVAVNPLATNETGSGSFLSPEWILTAGHVVDRKTIRPSDVLVTLGNPLVAGNQQRRAAAIYIHPAHQRGVGSSPQLPNEVDVALIRLESPFDADPFIWSLSSAAKSTLLNKLLSCQGYGQNVEGDESSRGPLRFADNLKVSSISTNSVQVNANQDPTFGSQIFLRGDSGGNCALPNLSIAGVISTVDPVAPIDFGHIVPVDSFRTWATGIMNSCGSGTPAAAGACSAACPCQYGVGDCNASSGCAAGLSCDSNVGAGFGRQASDDICVDTACAAGTLGSSTYCSASCPCGHGGGDCDSNSQCMDGLVCDSNVGLAFKMTPDSDICVPPQCSLKTIGADDYCSPDCPCGQGGGDCETAADCLPGLICAQNFGAAFGYKGVTDVCMPPECAVGPFIADGFCTPSCPCGVGGGDCDSDAECMPGLVCGTNNGRDFGQPADWDMCVRP